jgi:anthranilate synthase/aminodeoxychorismate synthase-like glutamine amidotransferase
VTSVRALLIDCRDSFTANLVHALTSAGAETIVSRSASSIADVRPTHLVLSPGPGSPRDALEAARALARCAGRIPVLGVCLGHQVIALAHGWIVDRAPRPVHGRASPIRHNGRGLFTGLPRGFAAARYHSLTARPPAREGALTADAVTDDDDRTVMAIRHRVEPTFGVQFHPESFLSEHGRSLLQAFLRS